MHKYISLSLITLFLSFSYGNEHANRVTPDITNFNQLDLGTNDFRDEADLMNFIEITM